MEIEILKQTIKNVSDKQAFEKMLSEKDIQFIPGTVSELFMMEDEEFDFVGPEENKDRHLAQKPPKIIAVSELKVFFPLITTTQGLNSKIKDSGIEPIKIGRNNYLTSFDVRKLFSKNNIIKYEDINLAVAVIATKGGVGKTTSTINIASRLVQYGFKVCVVDVDAQCNATQGLGAPDDLDNVLYEVISEEKDCKDIKLDDVILKVTPNLHLLPSGPSNTLLESYLALRVPRIDVAFQNITNELKKKYDIVLFDCSPSLGITNSGVLLAADEILIPFTPGSYSYKSVGKTLRWIRDVIDQFKSDRRKKIKVFINMFEERKMISKSYLVHSGTEKVLKNFNMSTYLPFAEAVKQQSEEGLSIVETNKNSRIKDGFISLVHELIGLDGDYK
ncbi:MAG: ParA family protein [Bdellovibrionales bacterium]|nr:ParA family protein [Bdellovibrionales bacterium]